MMGGQEGGAGILELNVELRKSPRPPGGALASSLVSQRSWSRWALGPEGRGEAGRQSGGWVGMQGLEVCARDREQDTGGQRR